MFLMAFSCPNGQGGGLVGAFRVLGRVYGGKDALDGVGVMLAVEGELLFHSLL